MLDPLLSYRELTFDFKEFPFACPEGVWRARLVMMAWGKGQNLLLYFRELQTNRGHCIAVFHGTHYAPINRGINFRYMGKTGQVFELETGKTRTGRTRFLSARIIGDPEAAQQAATPADLTPSS